MLVSMFKMFTRLVHLQNSLISVGITSELLVVHHYFISVASESGKQKC